MSFGELEEWYIDLEVYYLLPEEIRPTTKVTITRTSDKNFYRVPTGVILDQDSNRTVFQLII